MKRITFFVLFGLACLTACKSTDDSVSAELSKNPDDCVLTKINYSANEYDTFTYDSRGLMTAIQSYANGAQYATYTNVFDADGKITSQNLNGNNVTYVYSGTVLTKIQLLDNTQRIQGEYAVAFDAAGRIKTLTIQNTTGSFQPYEGYQSTFTYDGQGNCTTVELSDGKGHILSRTLYSNFVAVRSALTKYKNQYLNPYLNSITNLQYALPYKYPNTTPGRTELYSALDSSGNYTGTLIKVSEYVDERTGNVSGMQVKRVTTTPTPASTTTYEYTGCQ